MNGPRWRAVATGLAVALVLALGGLGLVLAENGDEAAVPSPMVEGLLKAEADAEKAARAAAVHLTTYDYRTLSTDFDWVVTAGTPTFRERYAEVSAPTKRYVTEFKVHAVGSVEDAAATAQDLDHVTVLLFVDQTLTSDAGAERQLATPRVRMSMVRSGEHWLVDDVAVPKLVAR